MNKRRPELLIPASSLEVLKTAVIFGADAVYIGGEAFGLRAKAKNFSKEDMRAGIEFAHEHGARVHVTVNILAHNDDLEGVSEYLHELKEMGPDALIIADPAIFDLAGEICPSIDRHISTEPIVSGGGWERRGWYPPGNCLLMRSGRSGGRFLTRWRSRASSMGQCVSLTRADAF